MDLAFGARLGILESLGAQAEGYLLLTWQRICRYC